MIKKFYCFVMFLIFSCNDQPSQSNNRESLFLQAERCVVDGGSLYIRCNDEKQKVIGLGYGKFTIIEEKEISEAYKFCNQEPVELSLNIKNAEVEHEEIKAANGFRVWHENLVDFRCFETHRVDNIGRIAKLRVKITPIPSQPKTYGGPW